MLGGMGVVRNGDRTLGMFAVLILPWFLAGCTAEDEPLPKKKAAASKPQATAPKAAPESNQTEVAEDPKTHPPFVLDMGDGLKMDFVWLPSGSFMMGDPKEGLPRRRVKIEKPFYLGKYEVTQEQWEYIMKSNPSLNKGEPDKRQEWIKRPVDRVNWDEVQAFLKAMNLKYATVGMKFDLPTEAQWEWSCKAGFSTRIGSSDDPDRLPDYAWYGGNSNRETHPVGTKQPNDWGLFDMNGNVAEWCADVASPADAAKPDTHVVRGGYWKDGETACRSTARLIRPGTVKLRYDGLRLLALPIK